MFQNLRCLGFLNQETCPVCRSGTQLAGSRPTRRPQGALSLRTTRSYFQSPKTSKSSPPCQALAEDLGPKRNPRAAGRMEWALILPASAAMVQGADNTGRTTRQQHLRSAPACGLERRSSLPLQRERCSAYGARGGPNRTWHGDPPEAPPT